MATTKLYEKSIRDMYRVYRDVFAGKLDRTKYPKVLDSLNRRVKEKCLAGKEVKIPYIGSLCIVKEKKESRSFDMHHYIKTGEKIPYDNSVSNGFIGSWKWNRLGSTVADLYTYTFVACRGAKRSCAEVFKTPNKYKLFTEPIKI